MTSDTMIVKKKKSGLKWFFLPYGKMSRVEYGLSFIIIVLIMSVIVGMVRSLTSAISIPLAVNIGLILSAICFVYLVFSICLKRLRDMNVSVFWIILMFVPYINLLFFVMLLFFPGRVKSKTKKIA